MEIYLTVAQVAERLQAHPVTIRGWIRDGKLQAVSAGRKFLVTEKQLQDFLIPAGVK